MPAGADRLVALMFGEALASQERSIEAAGGGAALAPLERLPEPSGGEALALEAWRSAIIGSTCASPTSPSAAAR